MHSDGHESRAGTHDLTFVPAPGHAGPAIREAGRTWVADIPIPEI